MSERIEQLIQELAEEAALEQGMDGLEQTQMEDDLRKVVEGAVSGL